MTATEFQTIPEGWPCGLPTTQELLTRRMLQAKEQVYKDIIRQVIDREPTVEDFKEVVITIHSEYPSQELIAYNGRPLGRILLSMDYELYKLTWTFEPNPTFKQDGTN